MGSLLQDTKYGLRMMAKNPGFTIVTAIALALGIGANTTMFSGVNAVLLRPLPYKDSDRLVWLSEFVPGFRRAIPLSGPDFLNLKEQNHVFDSITAFESAVFEVGGNETSLVSAALVSSDFFRVMGVEPVLGRHFFREEEQPGHNHVVILGYDLWQVRFSSDPRIVGKTVTLNLESYTVVGVMPRGFRYPWTVQMWAPIVLKKNRHDYYLSATGRLRSGITVKQALADLGIIVARRDPSPKSDGRVELISLKDHIVGDLRPALLILLGVTGFVLLIACANVANLLLARAAARQKEMAIRAVLGATRVRVIRQLLTESVLLSLLGGAFGLLLAFGGIRLLVAFSPSDLPRIKEIGIDSRVLTFTLTMSFLTGILFGLTPALSISSCDLSEPLKEGSWRLLGRNRLPLRSLIVVSETSLALVLLINAGLLIQSFLRLENVDPGFHADHVLTASIALPKSKYSQVRLRAAFFDNLLQHLKSLPGVKYAGLVNGVPFGYSWTETTIAVEGRPGPSHRKPTTAGMMVVSPDYFRAIGIPLAGGRPFSEHDNEEALKVAIVDETMARSLWPGENPVGMRIKLNTGDPGDTSKPWITVIGVVGHVKTRSLATDPGPELYVPYLQDPRPNMDVVLRTAIDPLSMTAALRYGLQAIDKDAAVFNVATMKQRVSESIVEPHFRTLLFSAFASLALILATLGTYGVMFHLVSQRTQEIGIRMALGAQSSHLLKLVLGKAMVLTLTGIALGVVVASGLSRLIASFLYGVHATDPVTFATGSLLLTGAALLASYIPARRATKVDPVVALRYE